MVGAFVGLEGVVEPADQVPQAADDAPPTLPSMALSGKKAFSMAIMHFTNLMLLALAQAIKKIVYDPGAKPCESGA